MWKKRNKRKTLQKQSAKLKIGDNHIPVSIYQEVRNNARVSIGKTGLSIRLPYQMSRTEQAAQVEQFYKWAVLKFTQRPELLRHQLALKKYYTGYKFWLQATEYELELLESDAKTGRCKVHNDMVYVHVPKHLEEEEQQKLIPQLISRAMAQKYYQPMYNRLLELNHLYFQKDIINFKLKYTHSVWGSCSRKGNINISTRLLFAVPDAIDYVLIHELAHMVHPNHSQAFWNEVARCMPDYKTHVAWLKEHGAKCDF